MIFQAEKGFFSKSAPSVVELTDSKNTRFICNKKKKELKPKKRQMKNRGLKKWKKK